MPDAKGESKCFSAGSQQPNLDEKRLTAFSMRLCPYAERVRLILNKKNIPHDIVNIDLKSKPDWFLQHNPLAKVPAIKEPGKPALFESLICAEYLDEKYPEARILPTDPFERAQQKVLIEIIAQKVIQPFYAVLKGGPESKETLYNGLADVEKMVKGKFFAGDKMGFVDLMVWPWFERLPALSDMKELDITKERYPKVAAWAQAMLSDPVAQEITYPKETFQEFLKGLMNNGNVNCDVGL
ncbi:glutathione S-transferase omega-1-like [Paramacrobiotus metropolitanus]|uniref:glutathione S-transferase omega-1-like n=1 Tax=Paramacrobiotus metropolitanus TaxID=2943436 RepID=UPI002445AEBC|nr:glutathione S-transferase omega-1-like [Paramacrobiotus metropolitanus]XP_055335800.1 glutathione S-transferase omega-1-like [Paramacrobiotus metropolitanus]XP_055335801.1 glutathione S-transferase omega-1-like [Paramacrobiotus metropolitanus]